MNESGLKAKDVRELLAGKDRLIGEVYSRMRAIEEAYEQLHKENQQLKGEIDKLTTQKQSPIPSE
ncbi:MAG: hypothetical protein HGJ94_18300 [Desulfosarcina sp.]|nr:hypothetical protein [Desulfosarcina sp.]